MPGLFSHPGKHQLPPACSRRRGYPNILFSGVERVLRCNRGWRPPPWTSQAIEELPVPGNIDGLDCLPREANTIFLLFCIILRIYSAMWCSKGFLHPRTLGRSCVMTDMAWKRGPSTEYMRIPRTRGILEDPRERIYYTYKKNFPCLHVKKLSPESLEPETSFLKNNGKINVISSYLLTEHGPWIKSYNWNSRFFGVCFPILSWSCFKAVFSIHLNANIVYNNKRIFSVGIFCGTNISWDPLRRFSQLEESYFRSRLRAYIFLCT